MVLLTQCIDNIHQLTQIKELFWGGYGQFDTFLLSEDPLVLYKRND